MKGKSRPTLGEGTLRKFATSRPTLKNAKENSLNRKEIIKGRHLGMLGMKKEHGKLKIWVNTISFRSPKFPKLYLMVPPKL